MLLLAQCKLEVLTLCIKNLSELALLLSQLVNLLLHLLEFAVKLVFLGSHFTQDSSVKLVVSLIIVSFFKERARCLVRRIDITVTSKSCCLQNRVLREDIVYATCQFIFSFTDRISAI